MPQPSDAIEIGVVVVFIGIIAMMCIFCMVLSHVTASNTKRFNVERDEVERDYRTLRENYGASWPSDDPRAKALEKYFGVLGASPEARVASEHRRLKAHCSGWMVSTFLIPILLIPPALGLYFANPCVNYAGAEVFYWVIGGGYILMYLMTLGRQWHYDTHTTFCMKEVKDNYVIELCMLYGSMGAALGFVGMYAYTLQAWPALGALACMGVHQMMYRVCFCQKHVRACRLYGTKHVENFPRCCGKPREWLWPVYNFFLTLVGLSIYVVAVFFNDPITEPGGGRPADICINI